MDDEVWHTAMSSNFLMAIALEKRCVQLWLRLCHRPFLAVINSVPRTFQVTFCKSASKSVVSCIWWSQLSGVGLAIRVHCLKKAILRGSKILSSNTYNLKRKTTGTTGGWGGTKSTRHLQPNALRSSVCPFYSLPDVKVPSSLQLI